MVRYLENDTVYIINLNNMITLKESILKSTGIGKDTVLKDVYNNTLNWLNKNNRLFHLTKDEITIKPNKDGYYLKINRGVLGVSDLLINVLPPYHFSEIYNKNNRPINFIFREFRTEDMPGIVNYKIGFKGCIIKKDAIIDKLPKNCKYLFFYPEFINGRKIPCKLNGIIKNITVDKFICTDDQSLDWDHHNIKNMTVKNECIISFVDDFSRSIKQNMLKELIANNHLNLDKLYIRDYSSECKYEKIIYDEINKKISFQKVHDAGIIYQLDELQNI